MLGAYPLVLTGRMHRPLEVAAALAVVVLAVALARPSAELVPWAFVLLGGEYATALVLGERGVDGRAPLVGAGFLLVAELAYWSLERRTIVADEPGLHARRLVLVVALAAAGGAVGTIAIALTALPAGGGLAWDALGAAAAGTALATVALLARRS